jgi:hypothetical protein
MFLNPNAGSFRNLLEMTPVEHDSSLAKLSTQQRLPRLDYNRENTEVGKQGRHPLPRTTFSNPIYTFSNLRNRNTNSLPLNDEYEHYRQPKQSDALEMDCKEEGLGFEQNH